VSMTRKTPLATAGPMLRFIATISGIVYALTACAIAAVPGSQAATTGPNLMADSSFESMDTQVFHITTPFRVTADPQAHSGQADVQATLSRRGKRMYSHVIFDDEFSDSSRIDVNNTQKDGYKWYVKGMWFPSIVVALAGDLRSNHGRLE
jgi:hypothetical protein